MSRSIAEIIVNKKEFKFKFMKGSLPLQTPLLLLCLQAVFNHTRRYKNRLYRLSFNPAHINLVIFEVVMPCKSFN
jgi:hypothetical protein